VVLIAAGVIFGYQGLQSHNVQSLVWVGYIPLALLFGGFYYVRRGRHYLEAADDGLRIGKTFSSLTIPYEQIRNVRVQPLNQLLPQQAPGGKKPYIAPLVKAHKDHQVVVLRLQGEDAELRQLARQLGPRHVFSGSAAFPVANPEQALREIAQHLPQAASTGHNLGGARRRGRKRR
jgi:hypothetical protein